MSSDDARTTLLRAEIERLKELLREKGFEAREIRTLFDDEATALRNAELRGSRLQTALTATQRELKSCMGSGPPGQKRNWKNLLPRTRARLRQAFSCHSTSRASAEFYNLHDTLMPAGYPAGLFCCSGSDALPAQIAGCRRRKRPRSFGLFSALAPQLHTSVLHSSLTLVPACRASLYSSALVVMLGSSGVHLLFGPHANWMGQAHRCTTSSISFSASALEASRPCPPYCDWLTFLRGMIHVTQFAWQFVGPNGGKR